MAIETEWWEFREGLVRIRLAVDRNLEARVEQTTDAEALPYWAVIWPSAVALGHRLAGSPTLPQRILELGCGSGLAGLVAAARGSSVTMLDRIREARERVRATAVHNELWVHVPESGDWQEWFPGLRWPLIVAADILYERSQHPGLLAAVDRLLEPPGEVWLVDPGRPQALDFFSLAERAGWRVELEFEPPPADVPAGGEYCSAILFVRMTCSSAHGRRRAAEPGQRGLGILDARSDLGDPL